MKVLALLALFATSCVHNAQQSRNLNSEPSCPTVAVDPDAAKPATNDSIALERARKYPRFMSIIIDGKRAAWNYPVAKMSENINFGLQRSDLKSMKRVESDEAERVYGVCPGVGLVLIETKSGNWQPSTSKSRE